MRGVENGDDFLGFWNFLGENEREGYVVHPEKEKREIRETDLLFCTKLPLNFCNTLISPALSSLVMPPIHRHF